MKPITIHLTPGALATLQALVHGAADAGAAAYDPGLIELGHSLAPFTVEPIDGVTGLLPGAPCDYWDGSEDSRNPFTAVG